MLVLKACPKCHGDLVREPALGAGHYSMDSYITTCLQCGKLLTEEEEETICKVLLDRRSRNVLK